MTPATTPAPTSCRVDCAGDRHELVWQDGALHTPDHPDADRERALTALGGQRYRCLQLADAWARHGTDLDVLLLAARGPRDALAPADSDGGDDDGLRYHGAYRPIPRQRRGGSGWYAYSSALTVTTDDESPRAGLDDVVRLGGGVPDRLVAQVVEHWAALVGAGDPAATAARPRLVAALYGRVAATARSWLGEPELPVDLVMVGPDETAVARRAGDRLHVELPFTWLAEVWLPGLALVVDRFTLSAARPEPGRYELTGVDRSVGAPGVLTVQLPPG